MHCFNDHVLYTLILHLLDGAECIFINFDINLNLLKNVILIIIIL
jgi:hypothetical protein